MSLSTIYRLFLTGTELTETRQLLGFTDLYNSAIDFYCFYKLSSWKFPDSIKKTQA